MSPQLEQARSLVTGMSLPQRISIVAVVLLVGGAIAALVHYRTESDFRPLYTAMAPEDAAPVVQKLRESGVEYRLADNGGTVLVPSEKLAESRLTLAGAGLPKSGRIGFELFDKTTFGTTELVEHINYQRALEGELERSVMSMSEVVQARVHLSLPKESVFLDQQQPAKASVMVKLRPGTQLSARNIMAVTNLVASAVEGLTPDAVALIDMDGTLLSRPRRISNGDDSQVTSEALEVRQQIERDLVNKINVTLEPLLGADKFRAGASVDCDLTSGEEQEETFDPDKSVMVSSSKTEDDTQRASTGGIPGTTSNLPNPPAQNGAANGASRRTENVTYQTSRVVKHTRIPQGVIRRMSLSVLVGQDTRWEGTAKARRRVVVPPSAETLKTIHDLIAGVTGFNADRGDQLIVETLPFDPSLTPDPSSSALSTTAGKPSTLPAWLQGLDKYRDTIVTAVLGLSLIGVLFQVVSRLLPAKGVRAEAVPVLEAARPAPSVAAHAEDLAELSSNARNMLVEPPDATASRVREFAQRDLTATANVLRMWMQDPRS